MTPEEHKRLDEIATRLTQTGSVTRTIDDSRFLVALLSRQGEECERLRDNARKWAEDGAHVAIERDQARTRIASLEIELDHAMGMAELNREVADGAETALDEARAELVVTKKALFQMQEAAKDLAGQLSTTRAETRQKALEEAAEYVSGYSDPWAAQVADEIRALSKDNSNG